MEISGIHRRSHCPVCGSTEIDVGYWRIPFTRLKEPVIIRGTPFADVPALDATRRCDCDRCRTCKAVYVNPVGGMGHGPGDAAIRFAAATDCGPYYEHIAEHFPTQATVLVDAACGGGELLDLAQQRQDRPWKRLVGLEICEAYVSHMHDNGHEAHCVDLHELDIPSLVGKVDFVIFTGSLEHMRDAGEVMRRLVKLLRRGGRMFFSAQALGGILPIRPGETIYLHRDTIDYLCDKLEVAPIVIQDNGARYHVVVEKP